ncbi:hypothetical protein GCM10012287_12860 [Streptomyces daqingensis]|uniref:Uncharacterized protein n=1 Tax=Streptomyces daqingensis TaxID=1472640 RepID=A0ABQ2M096_9ACTN|nr:hypothetical protein GCM10012287_12860 [Streptomyces daqingensis]
MRPLCPAHRDPYLRGAPAGCDLPVHRALREARSQGVLAARRLLTVRGALRAEGGP